MMETFFEIQSGPYWDWRVALDLFLGGAGVGAFLFAVLLDEIYPGRYRRLCHTASVLAPLLVMSGLAVLMMKMGRPEKIFLSYTHINLSSPLWWGGIFQPLLILGTLVYAYQWLKGDTEDRGRRILGRLLAPLALIVGAYHGLLLSLLQARPLWNTGPTVVSALLGFAATGIASVMLFHILRMKLKGTLADEINQPGFLADLRCVRDVLVSVLVLQLGTFFLWWLSLKYGSLQDQLALDAASQTQGTHFLGLGIGVGLILPLLLGGFAVLAGDQKHPRLQIVTIALSSLMILIGGYYFRLSVLLGGQVDVPFAGF